eukprot:UN07623
MDILINETVWILSKDQVQKQDEFLTTHNLSVSWNFQFYYLSLQSDHHLQIIRQNVYSALLMVKTPFILQKCIKPFDRQMFVECLQWNS